ncbi:hypothetical protein L3X38_032252 [Prunus dulcis]|uniref:Integrase catalytic domain-containing protein n=1 Tax=Prunus dulcis TaxID=3755 RepID=A0AAD4VDT3_PRUDU|nr:hypothetical protein L3X38_032252 [Prunus dulcis]
MCRTSIPTRFYTKVSVTKDCIKFHRFFLNSFILHYPSLTSHTQLPPVLANKAAVHSKDAVINKVQNKLTITSPADSRSLALLGQHVKTKLWHLRLGHVSNDVLHHMLKIPHIPLSVDSIPEMCDSCLQGKMHKLPFSSSSITSLKPFSKLHTDVWGPSAVAAVGGYRYFLTIIDDCTHYMWVFPLINKLEVASIFIRFHAYIVTYYQAQVQFLQSDGGGEYISRLFKDFLTSKGILHQLSCPYTLQQNGLAERKNRYLIETTLALLTVIGLSLPFWYYAMAHATFLINRMPSKLATITEPDTPYHFRQAISHPAWQQAMTEEIQALDQQDWLLSQEYGLDYDETFSPVVRHTTIHLILSLAVNFQWELRQLDVKNAFLYCDLQEEVFLKQPRGLFMNKTGSYVVILLLYVDDIIITGSNLTLVTSVIHALGEVFELKDLGKLRYFLGLEVSLQYLMFTRPDIAFAVNTASDPNTRKSTTGYCGNLI